MKKIVGGTKDSNGIYTPNPAKSDLPKEVEEIKELSIDTLLERSLRSVHGVMRVVENEISSGMPTRETIMNLKDITTMLWDFKKKEQEFLDSLTDEQLEKLKK